MSKKSLDLNKGAKLLRSLRQRQEQTQLSRLLQVYGQNLKDGQAAAEAAMDKAYSAARKPDSSGGLTSKK